MVPLAAVVVDLVEHNLLLAPEEMVVVEQVAQAAVVMVAQEAGLLKILQQVARGLVMVEMVLLMRVMQVQVAEAVDILVVVVAVVVLVV
jgi:hypothetical protein